VNGIGRVFLGLFTHHLGTKFLSLLLSFILLFVVQQSLEERRDLRDLKIKFQLSPDLRQDYVIIKDTFVLTDVRIEGLKTNVSELMGDLTRRSREVLIEVNQSFLERYPNRSNILVNREFCETHNIPGEGVRMTQEIPANLVLNVQKLENYKLRVVAAPGQEDKTLLSADNPYQGTLDSGRRIEIGFEPPTVELRCPPSVLTGDEHKELRVVIQDLAEWLRNASPEAGTPLSVQVTSIDWEASGFPRDALSFVQVVSPRNVRPAVLAGDLLTRFEVEERWVRKDVDLDLVVRLPLGRTPPAEAEFRGALGVVEFRKDWLDPEAHGKALGFEIEVPRALASDTASLAKLSLELDWATALATTPEDAASIYVPLRLRVKGGEDPALLKRVRIAPGENSAPGEQPRLRFDLR